MAMLAHRRYAREAALHALYLAEFAQISIARALEQSLEQFRDADVREAVLPEGAFPDEEALEAFARVIAEGTWERKRFLDEEIAELAVGYELDRLAAVDRNVLRLAAYELHHVPYVPPAVTINEWVEIAKKYSTAESGRFVNGVLASVLRRSKKAAWSPAEAPPDPASDGREEPFPDPRPEEAVETVEEGTDEARLAGRFGVWTVRSERSERG